MGCGTAMLRSPACCPQLMLLTTEKSYVLFCAACAGAGACPTVKHGQWASQDCLPDHGQAECHGLWAGG